MKLVDSKIQAFHLSVNETFTFPEKVYELSTSELLCLRRAFFSPYITSSVFFNTDNLPNVCYLWKVYENEGDKQFWIIEVIDKICFFYTINPIVFEWAKVRYSIDYMDNFITGVMNKIRITKFPIGVAHNPKKDTYINLKELKDNSLIYKSLKLSERTKVCDSKNIEIASDQIFSLSFGDRVATGKFLKHLLLGDIRKGNYTGIHHIYQVIRGNAQLIEIIDNPNINGVWRGKLLLKDVRHYDTFKNSKSKEKSEITSFFPNHWKNLELIEECKHAWDNKGNKIELSNSNRWESVTKCGISVLIITNKKNEILTMFPDWEKEKDKYFIEK